MEVELKIIAVSILLLFSLMLQDFVSGAIAAEDFPIKVVTTLESSNGLTESDMDMDMLSAFEDWFKAEYLEKSKQSFMRQGYSEDLFDGAAISTSHYVMRSGKKLGIVNVSGLLKSQNLTVIQLVRVFGLVGDGLATVGCLRLSNETIPVTFGACGEKVNEVFSLR